MNFIERIKHEGFLPWLWSLLPDNCETPWCERHGVRGNENRINGV